MATPTHYSTLGLDPSAPVAVIRASYKAHVLLHHPDKTLHLSAEERAAHASLFRNVQESYDVLSSASLKATYDAELARHGNSVDSEYSTFHHPGQSTPRRSTTVRLTLPEEKSALKARVEQDVAYLRKQRAKQDAEDARMDGAGLRFMLKTWGDLAEEHADDPYLRAHCAMQMQIYRTKVVKREQEHKDWLADLSKPKTSVQKPSATKSNSAPTPKAPRTAPTANLASSYSSLTNNTTPMYQSQRVPEKARKDAAKQAQVNAKAAASRGEKDQRQRKSQANAQANAERIAKAHTIARAVPKDAVGISKPVFEDANRSCMPFQTDSGAAKPRVQKTCAKCGKAHDSIAEWKKCNMWNLREEIDPEDGKDGPFFTVV